MTAESNWNLLCFAKAIVLFEALLRLFSFFWQDFRANHLLSAETFQCQPIVSAVFA